MGNALIMLGYDGNTSVESEIEEARDALIDVDLTSRRSSPPTSRSRS